MNQEVGDIITILDKVFKQLNQKSLLENSNFQLFDGYKANHFLQFFAIKKDERVDMIFQINLSFG